MGCHWVLCGLVFGLQSEQLHRFFSYCCDLVSGSIWLTVQSTGHHGRSVVILARGVSWLSSSYVSTINLLPSLTSEQTSSLSSTPVLTAFILELRPVLSKASLCRSDRPAHPQSVHYFIDILKQCSLHVECAAHACSLCTEEEEAVWAAQRDSDPSDDRTVGRRKEEG